MPGRTHSRSVVMVIVALALVVGPLAGVAHGVASGVVGRITYSPSGLPVTGATVYVEALDGAWAVVATVSTASDGSFDVFYASDLVIGRQYRIRIPDTLEYAAQTSAPQTFAGTTLTFDMQVVADASRVQRIAGDTRIDTAVEASKRGFLTADTVVIATAYNWPDALGGAALAGAVGGPLLLTSQTTLPGQVLTEIGRLGATSAYILGGPGAVGTGVEAALNTALGDANVTRLAGGDRYETSRIVAAEAVRLLDMYPGGFDGTAFATTGANFPDALAASPLSARFGWPLYLVKPSGVDLVLLQAMRSAHVTNVVVLGGEGAVDQTAEIALRQVPAVVSRLAGDNRYQTSTVIAYYGVAHGCTWNNVAVATGDDFPDALSGGVLQAGSWSVMLLTPRTSLELSVREALRWNKSSIFRARILGGTSAVSAGVQSAVDQALQ